MGLNRLLAKERGLCMVINQTCCVYVNQEKRIETDLQQNWITPKILHQVSLDDTSLGFSDLWEKFTSCLPHFMRLKQPFVVVIIIIVLELLICITLRCFLCM